MRFVRIFFVNSKNKNFAFSYNSEILPIFVSSSVLTTHNDKLVVLPVSWGVKSY